MSLGDEEIAQIVNVALPEFGLTEIGKLPAASVRIWTVDLKDIVAVGAGEAVLASVKIQAVKAGSTPLTIALHAMDDDSGDPMDPQLVHGLVEVQ